MKNVINLTKIYASYLCNKKSFLYSLIVLIVISLFLIPNKDSAYITFYIGKYTGESNGLWVSSLGAIFTNLVLSFVAFFLIEGSYKSEKESGLVSLINSTASSNIILLFYKWLSYIILLFTFLIIIILTLFVINYNYFNGLTFLKPFIYFNFSYIFILSSLILVFDIFIRSGALKIIIFIFLIFFFASTTGFDLLGFNEFTQIIKDEFGEKYNIQNEFHAMGLIVKTQDLIYLKIEQIDWLSNIYKKIILIPLSISIIYVFSFLFRRYQSKTIVERLKKTKRSFVETKNDIYNFSVISYSNPSPKIKKSIISSLLPWLLLFKNSFSKFQSILIIVLWILSFFMSYSIASGIFIPLIFLVSFNLYEKFINIDNKKNLTFSFITSIYSINERLFSKIIILFTFFVFCAVPLFFLKTVEANLVTVICLLSISVFSVLFSYMLKSVKLLEVFYIILFASYLAGYPVFNIL